MKKKIVFFIAGIIFVYLIIVSIVLVLKNSKLKKDVKQFKQLFLKLQEDNSQIKGEKEKLVEETNKYQEDAVYYLGINNSLQEEIDVMKTKLLVLQGLISTKEEEVEESKKKATSYDLKRNEVLADCQRKLVEEKKEFEKQIKLLEGTLEKERALFHYNLAVAYTQARLYDEGIEAYEKSLVFDADNPDAHYNLGILYDNFKKDPEKAVFHYRKYLKLNPAAEDRSEVLAWIEKLE